MSYRSRNHTTGGRMYRARLERPNFVEYRGPYNTIGPARVAANAYKRAYSDAKTTIEFVPADAWKEVEPWVGQ